MDQADATHLGEGRERPLNVGTAIAQGIDISQGLEFCVAGLLMRLCMVRLHLPRRRRPISQGFIQAGR